MDSIRYASPRGSFENPHHIDRKKKKKRLQHEQERRNRATAKTQNAAKQKSKHGVSFARMSFED
jgi:hypothetical protein